MSCKKTNTGCTSPAQVSAQKGCCEVGVSIMPMDGVDYSPDPCALGESPDPCEDPCRPNTSLYAIATAPFNMPACGQTTEMQTTDALRFAPGSVLYSPAVGSLYVAGVRDNWTLILRNDCGSCQLLQPGEVVLTNSVFALGGPACISNAGGVGDPETTPFLDSDLVVPLVGQCVTAKVTNIFGLSIGDIVSINGLEFRIGGIVDGTTVQFCNDGEGGEPNSVIQHDPDNDTVSNYPVVRVAGENPCTGTVASEVERIIGCNGAGLNVGVEGKTEGHILVWNDSLGRWVLQVIEGAALCVVLGADLTISDADAADHEYPVLLSGTTTLLAAELANYSPNFLKITIDGNPFCLTSIVDDNTISVRRAYDPTGIQFIQEGAIICVIGCCQQCTAYIETSDLDGGEPDVEEATFVQGPIIISAASGVSVRTFPVGIGINGDGSNVDTDAAWLLRYRNGDSCACRKYVEVFSNFECAIDLPTGVFANVEFRILKVLPVANTFTGASIPFTENRRQLAALAGTPNLLLGGNPGDYQLVNTFKGHMFDRDIAEPGVLHQYQGHVRIVLENTTGGPLDTSFACSWRAWLKASNFELVTDPVP